MTCEEYWVILSKRWHIVLMCLILVGGGAWLVSLMLPPVYRSTALIQVALHAGENQSDINELLASNQLMQTEAQLATSDTVLQVVISHHSGLTLWQLENMVSSEPKLNTQLFELHVQDNNAGQAALLANEIAMAFVTQQEQAQQHADQDEQHALQQEIDTNQKQIAVTKSLLSTAGSSAHDSITQQLTTLQEHNSQWQSALTQLELVAAQSSKFLLIVQPARLEANPVQPLIALNTLAGSGVGLLLGLLMILVVEKVDQRVGSTKIIRQIVDWPVLAIVWNSQEPQPIDNSGVWNINTDAYHLLRSRIGFAATARPLRYLLVTSALPYEGKSTIAANLAVCMAMAGKNTLLIDGDLRCPALHEKFGLAAEKPGLSNALISYNLDGIQSSLSGTYQAVLDVKTGSLENFMHKVGIAHLRVMPSGPLPPDPSALLDSSAMRRFFEALDHCGAEVVIWDSSSALGIPDAAMLSSKVDGTIVVVDPKRVCRRHLCQVQINLAQAGAYVVGYVINKQHRYRQRNPPSYYQHYYSVGPVVQKEWEIIPDV